MRTCLMMALAVLLLAKPGLAEDAVKPEQLKKMYDDALAQLKAAQDRKAELSRENEIMTVKLQELQKQLAATQDQMQALQRKVAEHDDQTFALRAYQAAWRNFLRHHPDWLAQWRYYLGRSVLSFQTELPSFLNFDWQPGVSDLDYSSVSADPQTASWKEEKDPASDSVGP